MIIYSINRFTNKIILKYKKSVELKQNELNKINQELEIKIKDEVEKSTKQFKMLQEQSKMSALGEMIGNIAHQWRQPLSVISSGATGIQLHKEVGSLSDSFLDDTCNIINTNAQYLSKTIDDFKNFIKGDVNKTVFNLQNNIDSFLNLLKGSIKNHNINVILDVKDIRIDGYENELTQCLINILNNSIDVLKEKIQYNRLIFITTTIQNNNVIIKIKDNGKGIPKNIINRIFEPYFTTKHKSQGTGLGLHMTYNLIVDGMRGSIEVNNTTYEYEGKNYNGAEFTIELPL